MQFSNYYRAIVLGLFTFMAQISFSQNMVLNPGFEEVNESYLLCSWYTDELNFLAAVDYWDYPNLATSDFFHMSLDESCYGSPFSTHSIAVGQQQPHGGDAMSAIITIGPGFACSMYREYLQGELTQDLTVGTTYNISVYVSMADNHNVATNNIGFKFTTERMDIQDYCIWETTPDVNYSGAPITDKDGWTLLTYTFTPTEPNLRYFSIGNFINNNGTTTEVLSTGSLTNGWYFVDDVSIEPVVDECTIDAPTTISPNQTFCVSDNASLNDLEIEGANIQWYAEEIGGAPLDPTNYEMITGTYYASQTIDECESERIPIIVTINQEIVPDFDPVDAVCEGDEISPLPTTSLNGITGSWSPDIDNITTTTYAFTPDPGQCATSGSLTIVVNPIVTPTFDPIEAVCFGANFSLPETSLNGVSGTWSPEINSTQSSVYTFTPAPDACANTTTMEVTILEPLDFEIIETCLEDDFILEATMINDSFDPATATVVWDLDGNNEYFGTSFNATEYVNGSMASQELPWTINVTVETGQGCSLSRSFTIENMYCNIQQGISPNGDGANDSFDLSLLEVEKLTIYNRYGTKIYSKNNYTQEWQGQTNDGQNVPDGTYYYHITFKNGNAPKVGWIYLNR